MAHVKKHDYHILQPSIWPLVAAVGAFAMLFGAVNWMHSGSPWLFLIGLAAVLYVMFAWWSDVVHESHDGDHTPVVRLGLKYGFIMFIMSEVMFFVAWFWAFFKHTIFPMSEYEASTYVIPDIHIVDPFHLPLINTLVLLLSGCLVTWAHHALVHNGARKDIEYGLLGAVVLGLAFTGLQAYEYFELIAHEGWQFIDGDRFYSTFFMATGFHGFHVVIGTIFLFVCYLRVRQGHFTAEKHVGFEAAAWYWHFVDVVWLFLFLAVYIWGQG
ncbi:cytochrome c oxidase subunit 3 [Rhodobacterales bacterium HKCCE4037]|nr:cytochrome c oxidase subunit 3 [Rhodobacterales bacterium HKCCE4037]